MNSVKKNFSPASRKETSLAGNQLCETPTVKNFEKSRQSPIMARSPTIFNNNFNFSSNLVRAPLTEKSENIQSLKSGIVSEFSSSQKSVKVSQYLFEKNKDEFGFSSPTNQVCTQKLGFSQLLNRNSGINIGFNRKSQVKTGGDENEKPKEGKKQQVEQITIPTLGDAHYEYRVRKAGPAASCSKKDQPSIVGCNFLKTPSSISNPKPGCGPSVSKFTFFSCGGREAVKDSVLEAPRDTHEILNTSENAKALGQILTGVEHVRVEDFNRDLNEESEEMRKKGSVAGKGEDFGSSRGQIFISEDLDLNSNYSKSIHSNNGNCTINNISALGKKKIFDKSFQSGLGDIGDLKEIMDYLMIKGNGTPQISNLSMMSSEESRPSSLNANAKCSTGLTRTISAVNLNERKEGKGAGKEEASKKRSVSPMATQKAEQNFPLSKDAVLPKKPIDFRASKSPRGEESAAKKPPGNASPQERGEPPCQAKKVVSTIFSQIKSEENCKAVKPAPCLLDSSNFSTETLEVGDTSEIKLNAPPEFRTNTHSNLVESKIQTGSKAPNAKESMETPAKKLDSKYYSDGKKHNPLNTAGSDSAFNSLHMNSTPKFTRNQLNNTGDKSLFHDLKDVPVTPPEQRRLFESEEYEKIERANSMQKSKQKSPEIMSSPSKVHHGSIADYYGKFAKPMFAKKQEPEIHELDTFYECQPSQTTADKIKLEASPKQVKGLRESQNSSKMIQSMSRFHSCDFSSMGLLSQIQNETEPRKPDIERPFYHQKALGGDEKPLTSNTSFGSTGNSQVVFQLNSSMIMNTNPNSGRSNNLAGMNTNRHQHMSTRSSYSLSGFSLTPFETKGKEDIDYLKSKYLNETSLYKLSLESGKSIKVACFTPKEEKEAAEDLNSERVAMVFCQDCKEYVDLRQSKAHSKRCGKELNLAGEESVAQINEKLKGLMNLMLERIKRLGNIEAEIINIVLMLASCIELIINNNDNCDILFEFLVDSNMLNKRLADNSQKLAQGMLGISHRVPELTKQKINSIRKRQESARVGMKQAGNVKQTESVEQKKKKFFELATNIRRQLPQNHKSNNLLIAEIFAEVLKKGLAEHDWAGFLCSKYFQAESAFEGK